MSWPKEIRDDILVRCGRHCCICHKFCGLKIELHHIKHKSEGGEDSADNCIALCFDCHADQRSYDHTHPKGLKYSREELIRHRDKWYKLVNQNLGTGTPEHIEQDKHTFYLIYQIISPDPLIRYLKEKDFGEWKFSLKPLRPIYTFLQKIDDEPWVEFYDIDLETLKEELVHLMGKFCSKIASDTFDFKDGSYDSQCVPREWEIDQPERYSDTVAFLNQMAGEIVETYTSFVRLGKQKLGVIL
ncbi:MAG: HNH endonuclease [Saprospiraceae bacterium]|nr:HNH endonuclease [Saprospiraceae bacterium]